jgi:hypothetical protein
VSKKRLKKRWGHCVCFYPPTPSALLPIGNSRPLSARHLVRPVHLLSSNHLPLCLGGPPTTCRNDPHGPVLPLRRPLLLSPLWSSSFSSSSLILLHFCPSSHTRRLHDTCVLDTIPASRIHIAVELFCSYTVSRILISCRSYHIPAHPSQARLKTRSFGKFTFHDISLLAVGDFVLGQIYFYASATTPELLRATHSTYVHFYGTANSIRSNHLTLEP